MIQLIFVIIIVSMAFGAAGYKLYIRFFKEKDNQSACSGCTGCGLKQEYKKQQEACSDDPVLKQKLSQK